MSLDVTLISEVPTVKNIGTGIYTREGGKTRELTYEEACIKYPDSDIEESTECYEDNVLYDDNITHNLGEMADKAGLYDAIWRPYRLTKDYSEDLEKEYRKEMEYEDSQTIYAEQLITNLSVGLINLLTSPKEFKKYNPENGWGTYEQLCDFTYNYLKACTANPTAIVKTDR